MTSGRRFDLIETMRHDPLEGVIHLDRHLARLKASAAELGFAFNRHDARNELQAASFGAGEARVRLLVARGGAMAVEVRPIGPAPQQPLSAILAPLPMSSDDARLRHASSESIHDRAGPEARFETVYLHSDGLVWGGAGRDLFLARDGALVTPRGRTGIVRDRLIEEGEAVEADIRAGDLEEGFLLGDPLHGLLRAVLAPRA